MKLTGNQKLAIFAGASVLSLLAGIIMMNDQASWLGGGLLVFGFIGSILSAVSYRNKSGQ
jgi:hypothetical protein